MSGWCVLYCIYGIYILTGHARLEISESAVVFIHASPKQKQGNDGKGNGVDGKSSMGEPLFTSLLCRGIENHERESWNLCSSCLY